jgi:DNA invertase Pin-like site-specific DNA recombinase
VDLYQIHVSTDEQNLSLQRDALGKAGCKRIFTDTASGAPTKRPGLADALSHLRKGDSLVVWKLDRLGRSVKGLVDLVGEFETRQVHFRSLTDGIDTKTPAGRFFFHVMASLAQMERELIVERTRAGLGAARKLGRIGGRPRRMTTGKIESADNYLRVGCLLETWPGIWPFQYQRYTGGYRQRAVPDTFDSRLLEPPWRNSSGYPG